MEGTNTSDSTFRRANVETANFTSVSMVIIEYYLIARNFIQIQSSSTNPRVLNFDIFLAFCFLILSYFFRINFWCGHNATNLGNAYLCFYFICLHISP